MEYLSSIGIDIGGSRQVFVVVPVKIDQPQRRQAHRRRVRVIRSDHVWWAAVLAVPAAFIAYTLILALTH
jgi:hypothetical protein